MTLPLLGPLGLSGFTSPWFFSCLIAAAAVVAIYLVEMRRRRRRTIRFANMAVLESVATKPTRQQWRHLPLVLAVLAIALLTTAMAGPTANVRVPRNRAVVMLVVDVSDSMAATDVAPSRIAAARIAGKHFADGLTPGINLGLVEFAAGATLLVTPTTDRGTVDRAIDTLQPQPRTATGEGILTALQAVSTFTAVAGGGDGPPPARLVLESDGAETVPADPNDARGAFTAARAARDQHVGISTISFGTPNGTVEVEGTPVPVPVDDTTLQTITEISGGQSFHAGSLDELTRAYSALQQQIDYETVRGNASASWTGLGVLVAVASIAAGITLNRRLPV